MSYNSNKVKNLKLKNNWQEHIKKWANTNLTQIEYCKNNELRASQFTYWKSKLSNSLENSVGLVQVPVPVFSQIPESIKVIKSSDFEMRIIINNDFQIEVNNDFSSQSLKRLVLTLKEIS